MVAANAPLIYLRHQQRQVILFKVLSFVVFKSNPQEIELGICCQFLLSHVKTLRCQPHTKKKLKDGKAAKQTITLHQQSGHRSNNYTHANAQNILYSIKNRHSVVQINYIMSLLQEALRPENEHYKFYCLFVSKIAII